MRECESSGSSEISDLEKVCLDVNFFGQHTCRFHLGIVIILMLLWLITFDQADIIKTKMLYIISVLILVNIIQH